MAASKKRPVSDSRTKNLLEIWDEKTSKHEKLLGLLDSRLDELELYVRSCLLGDTLSPHWLTGDLHVSQIDRKKFTSVFADDRIRIARWRPSDQPETLTGSAALFQAIQVNYAPWLAVEDVDISITIGDTTQHSDEIVANVMVEVFGQPEASIGRTATSIWNTKWRIDDFIEKLSLSSVTVLGQEETLNYTEGGKLFADSTGWVMQNFKRYRHHLGRSLEDWATTKPGLDIRGEHGISVSDINRDGLDDIYVCQPAGIPNLLFVQNPDGTVDEVAEKLGLAVLDHTSAALMLDLDDDRDQDLVLSTKGGLLIYSQAISGKFELENRIAIGHNGCGLSAADYDQDGDLDLFLCRYDPPLGKYSDIFPRCRSLHDARDGGRNILLRNEEVWKFTDVTHQVGLEKNNGLRTRSAMWLDYDLDGDQDLYIANEFNRDQLFENKDGWFKDVTVDKKMVRFAKHRTVSLGEFNGDGRPDLFVGADVPTKAHQLCKDLATADQTTIADAITGESLIWHSRGENFISYTFPKPIFACQSSNSSVVADLNNDGLSDVVVTNGWLTREGESLEEVFYRNIFAHQLEGDDSRSDAKMFVLNDTYREVSELCREGYSFGARQANRCFLNIGKPGLCNFSKISGLDLPDDCRAIAATDWDHDGDVDLIISSRTAPQLRVMINQLETTNQHIVFQLVGNESNQDAIGSRVEVYPAGQANPIVAYVTSNSGYLSQSSKRITIGLGSTDKIAKVVVVWPNGNRQEYQRIEAGRVYRLVEGRTEAAEQNNDRLNLVGIEKIPPRVSTKDVEVKRILFSLPFKLPIIEYQGAKSEYFDLECAEDRTLLVVLWSRNTASDVILQKFANSAEKFESKDIDVLALFVDRETDSESEHYYLAEKAIELSGFPFRWGTLAPSSITKLELLLGEWVYNKDLGQLPIILTIDDKEQVCFLHAGAETTTDQVVMDASIVSTGSVLSENDPLSTYGQWVTRHKARSYRRLANTFDKLSFTSDAMVMKRAAAKESGIELAHFAMDLHSIGAFVKAKTQFEKALQLDAACVPAYVGQGQLLLEASRVEPPDARARLRVQAGENFAMALKHDPLNTTAIIGAANVAGMNGDYETSIQQLKDFLEVQPENYKIHAIIGRLHNELGRKPGTSEEDVIRHRHEAASHLKTAFDNHPTLPHVAGDLGVLYFFDGDYGNARDLLRFATKIQPSVVNFKRYLGEAEFRNKNFDFALERLLEFLESSPSDVRCRKIVAWLYATCPYESYRNGPKGIEIAKNLLEIAGEKSNSTLEILAACYAEVNDFEKAIELQEKAFRLVDTRQGADKYTPEQIKGLNVRLSAYLRKRPYRTEDVKQVPISKPKPAL